MSASRPGLAKLVYTSSVCIFAHIASTGIPIYLGDLNSGVVSILHFDVLYRIWIPCNICGQMMDIHKYLSADGMLSKKLWPEASITV